MIAIAWCLFAFMAAAYWAASKPAAPAVTMPRAEPAE